MTTDRAGEPLVRNDFVAVLPYTTREEATIDSVRRLGVEFFGTVIGFDGDYVTIMPDEGMRGVVSVRSDLVLRA